MAEFRNDPRYSQLTADSLPLEQQNLGDLFKDRGFKENNRNFNKGPWKVPPPSRRVANCEVTMWIYNVAPRKHAISSLPGMPKVLAACPFDEKGNRLANYGAPLAIKEITLDYAGRGDYKLDAVEVDDVDLVRAILCPSCGGDQKDCRDTADLRIWGVFYSTHNPKDPVDAKFQAELDEANRRLSITMSQLVKVGDSLYEDQSKRWQLNGAYGDVYRMAAKYKKIQRPWCTPLSDKESCPGCGYTNERGAMVCAQGTCGITLDYKKALRFRKITQAEYDEVVEAGLIDENGRLITV